MCRFGDSNLILEYCIRFTVKIAGLLSKLDRMVEFTDTRFVFIRAAQCSVISCNTFQRMARLKQVKLDSGWSESSSTSGSLKLCHRLL